MASGLRCGAYTHTGGEKGEDEGVTWIGQTKHNSKHTHSTAAVTTPHAAGAPFIFFLPVAQTSWNHHCLMYNMRVLLNHAANRSWATAVQHVAIHMWTGWKRVRMLNKTNSWIHRKLSSKHQLQDAMKWLRKWFQVSRPGRHHIISVSSVLLYSTQATSHIQV